MKVLRAERCADRGAVAYVALGVMLVVLVLCAFVIDRGYIYYQRARLQAGVDAMALAAGQEMCDPTGLADPVAVANNYAQANGLPKTTDNPPSIVLFKNAQPRTDTSPAKPAYVTVKSSVVFNPFFGNVTGVKRYQIGAVAAASRSCAKSFKIFADRLLEVTGSGNDGGNFFAGSCFKASSGGVFSLVATRSPLVIDKSVCLTGNQTTPIDPAATVPDPNNKKYDQTLTLAAVMAGIPFYEMLDEANANRSSRTTCPVQNDPFWDNPTGPLVCTGPVSMPGGRNFPYSIVTDGDIDVGTNSSFCSTPSDCTSTTGPKQMIYSSAGSISLNQGFTVGGSTYLIAPNGSVDASGQGVQLEGYIVSFDTKFSGGNLKAGAGMDLPFPGPVALSD